VRKLAVASSLSSRLTDLKASPRDEIKSIKLQLDAIDEEGFGKRICKDIFDKLNAKDEPETL
jgi:hypothetical protein